MEEKYDIRSFEIQELIGAVPSWLVRWGSTLVLLILMGILLFSYLLKYPDVVSAPVEISTDIPPIPLITKSGGKLSALLVKDNEHVDSNQVLCVMESEADYQYVLFLDSLLHVDSILSMPEIKRLDPKRKMGVLQGDYSAFINSLQEENLFTVSNYKAQQISKINESISFQRQLIMTYQKQINSTKKELSNSQQKYNNDYNLFKKGIISSRELQESESNSIRLQNQIENLNANIANGQVSITNFQKELADVNVSDAQVSLNKKTSINSSFNNLKSKIDAWKSTYLIISPTKGNVSFNTIRNQNQFIEAGKTVLSIVQKNDHFMGRVLIPARNAGKVKLGQHVLIKLDNYPSQEYGTLDAEVINISAVPIEGKYIVELSLPANNETSYHKKLLMQQDMQGTADIITERKRLIAKFFDKLKFMFNNNL